MTTSTIITIVVLAVFGLVVLWAFKSGNNIKLFGKKERKPKSKVSEEEKYKDVVPKEKKKKEPKVVKDKVKEELKSQKTTDSAPSENKVVKITREDFQKNDMPLPDALLTEDEKKNKLKNSLKKEMPTKPYDFNFDDDFNFGDSSILGEDPFFGDSEFRDLLSPSVGPKVDDLGFPSLPKVDPIQPAKLDLNLPKVDITPSAPKVNYTKAPDIWSSGEVTSDGFSGGSVDERFNKVFGGVSRESLDTSFGKEILIGEVLGAPRARTAKLEREKRKKWMK